MVARWLRVSVSLGQVPTGLVRVWAADSGKAMLAHTSTGISDYVLRVSWSPVWRAYQLASGSVPTATVRVWDVRRCGEVIATNWNRKSRLRYRECVVVTSLGITYRVGGSTDGTVRVWNADSGKQLLATLLKGQSR